MRYWLYQRVYWNQPNRAYNAAIRRALLDLQQVLTFEKEMRQIALYFDEREMLFFLHERAVNYNLSETIELLDLVKGSEKILYREVFDRNLRQCEADPGTMDRTEIEMLISSTMSYKTMRKFEIELQQWLFDSLPHQPAKGAPLVLLDVPFEPGNIKLGTDIFVQLPPTSKFENSPQSLTTLEKVSPVIEGVNSNFSSDLQRLRIFVRPDLKFDLDIGQRIYHKLRTLLNS